MRMHIKSVGYIINKLNTYKVLSRKWKITSHYWAQNKFL